MMAFAFNLCLVFLPLAAASAIAVISRDHLYAYEYSEAGARAVSNRVERLNGALIQLDFDRQRQWDDLVAMELMAGDVGAARGLLLSAPGMLPGRAANQVRRDAGANADDAAIERAALELLTPGTRAGDRGSLQVVRERLPSMRALLAWTSCAALLGSGCGSGAPASSGSASPGASRARPRTWNLTSLRRFC